MSPFATRSFRTLSYAGESSPHKRKRTLDDFESSTSDPNYLEADPSRNSITPGRDKPRIHTPPDTNEQLQASEPNLDTTASSSYIQRTEILGHVRSKEDFTPSQERFLREDSDPPYKLVLQTFDACDVAAEQMASRLVHLFTEYCLPWAPITERSWLSPSGRQSIPHLLLQSILLTGSRVSSSSTLSLSVELYQKAKALFFYNSNTMPLASVVSAILLQ